VSEGYFITAVSNSNRLVQGFLNFFLIRGPLKAKKKSWTPKVSIRTLNCQNMSIFKSFLLYSKLGILEPCFKFDVV